MLDNDTLQVEAIRKIKVCLSMETLLPVEAEFFMLFVSDSLFNSCSSTVCRGIN